MIIDRQSQLNAEIKARQEAAQLNSERYARDIHDYAEYKYSQHRMEAYLGSCCFDGNNYFIDREKKSAFLYDYPIDRIDRFCSDLRNLLLKEGFVRVVVRSEWYKVRTPDSSYFKPSYRQGYAVFYHVEW